MTSSRSPTARPASSGAPATARSTPSSAASRPPGSSTRTRSRAGRVPRRVYRLTEDGRLAFESWLSEPGDQYEVRDEGLLKLFFGEAMPEEQLEELVRRRREWYQEAAALFRRDRRGGRAVRGEGSERSRAPLRDRADGVERGLVEAPRARAQLSSTSNTPAVGKSGLGRRRARGDLGAVRLVADGDDRVCRRPRSPRVRRRRSRPAPAARRSAARRPPPSRSQRPSRARAAAGSRARAPAPPARGARPAPCLLATALRSAASASPGRPGPSGRGGRGRGARG